MDMNNEAQRKMLGLLGVTLCIYAILKIRQSRRRQPRRFKVRPINRTRRVSGGFKYYEKMKEMDSDQFFKYTRLTKPAFEKLLTIIKPFYTTSSRSDGILPEERLVVTLQYLSQGNSMQSLAWHFNMGHATVHKILKETCDILWNTLSPIYLKCPSTVEEWQNISKGFCERWNMPHCLGALDGKHVHIQAPARSGSQYYNYKNSFSVVLLASCDSKYKFNLVDIGAYGSQSDGGIFRLSLFGTKIETGTMNIPSHNTLPNSNKQFPYFFVADEAFPLKRYIMRPYPGKTLTKTQRLFNYRISRARMIIENTFGIMVARWRLLRTTINAKVENVDNFIKAIVVLHNFCQTELEHKYCPPDFVDSDGQENGGWRDEAQTPLVSVGRMASNVSKREIYGLRNTLADYLVTEGKVSWQEDIINKDLPFSN